MSTRIIKKFDLYSYREIIAKNKENIFVNPHAYFRLSQAQRKIYNEQDLIKVLINENPVLFGMQQNGRYTPLYSAEKMDFFA